jgi:hypothetical protein
MIVENDEMTCRRAAGDGRHRRAGWRNRPAAERTIRIVLLVAAVLVVAGLGYLYYRCPGFNDCFNNSICQHDCYENGKRVR